MDSLLDGVNKDLLTMKDKIASLEDQVSTLEVRIAEVGRKLTCNHEPFCVDGKNPLNIIAIADARKVSVIAPGQEPPMVFALAICKHCWQPFPIINKLDEVPPHDPSLPKPKLARPGDIVE